MKTSFRAGGLLAWWIVWLVPVGGAPSPSFVAGDRWVAVGDSITQDGAYARHVDVFHVLRLPSAPVTYVNAGVSGDSAAGALRRFGWDILPLAGPKPGVATVMLGMNDVGRDLYAADIAEDDAIRQKRRERLDAYAQNLRRLVDQLQAAGVRVVLFTPSPYDDTAATAAPNLPGVNTALAAVADIVRALAAERDLALIDLHGPLTALARRRQAAQPEFTPIGKDRIHPGAAGGLAMAYFILRAQHAAGPFVQVHVRADLAATRFARGATVGAITREAGGVGFDYLASALPAVWPENAREALDWVPLAEELNREELRVTGLAAGDHTVAIDGKIVATFSAEALGRGVNLAALATPQARQAADVLALMEERWEAIARLRRVASVEYWQLPDAARPLTLAQMETKLAAWEAKLAAQPSWQSKHPGQYREWKPLEAQIAQLAETKLAQARAAAKPVTRRVVVAPAARP